MSLTCARRLILSVLVLGVLSLAPARAGAETVLVFAAASLKNALDEIVGTYEGTADHEVTVSYASSSVLARQIQQGAPADLFISANQEWMDVLQDQGAIDATSRVDLLGNGLVLIGRPDQAVLGQMTPDVDLQSALAGGHLAMALVDAVPAGIYGKAALQNLGLWDGVRDHVAQSDNARAALALVAAGATPMGIVYRSDARAEDKVQVIASFAPELHPEIVYPAAVTRAAAPAAREFLAFLQSDTASSIFAAQGFSLPGR